MTILALDPGSARKVLAFTVHGTAQPRGSKTVAKARSGKTWIRDDNPKSKDWMQQVAQVAGEAMDSAGLPIIDQPVSLRLTFTRARKASDFGKRGLRNAARAYPDTIPDLTKLLRGVEDAMQGVVMRNDSRIVEQSTRKIWGERDSLHVEVFVLSATVGESVADHLAARRRKRRE